jgi:hypothetical protein
MFLFVNGSIHQGKIDGKLNQMHEAHDAKFPSFFFLEWILHQQTIKVNFVLKIYQKLNIICFIICLCII